MRIAVVGAGVSGLVAAHLLHRDHDVTVFEASERVGGHARTRDVWREGRAWAVDTGFVVYNEATYPLFTRLLDDLGVDSRPTEMSFAVSCARTGLEWRGTNLDTVFAQRRNLLRPSFLGMLAEVLRFNRRAPRMLASGLLPGTLGELLDQGGYGEAFRSHYLVPMASAIWSSDPERVLEMPAEFFVRFFENHGLLRVREQLPWRVVEGGSRRYVEALVRPFRHRIRTSCPVLGIRREAGRVRLRTAADGAGPSSTFDQVILALHADQALRLLEDPSRAEREVLASIPFQSNEAVLHTDETLLPRTPRARAAWNVRIPRDVDRLAVTYDMSRLQGLESPAPFCLSLNLNDRVGAGHRLEETVFEHPVFGRRALSAQARWEEISGRRGTHYCGAWWRNGFHEDGVWSALRVARELGARAWERAA